MYQLTIYTKSGNLYSFKVYPLSLARDLVARMGSQVKAANICKFNEPLLRLKG